MAIAILLMPTAPPPPAQRVAAILVLMITPCVFLSMWMSNTATTAMMFPLGAMVRNGCIVDVATDFIVVAGVLGLEGSCR